MTRRLRARTVRMNCNMPRSSLSPLGRCGRPCSGQPVKCSCVTVRSTADDRLRIQSRRKMRSIIPINLWKKRSDCILCDYIRTYDKKLSEHVIFIDVLRCQQDLNISKGARLANTVWPILFALPLRSKYSLKPGSYFAVTRSRKSRENGLLLSPYCSRMQDY